MTAPPLTRRAAICNKRGLHARPAARFVTLAARFKAEVKVSKDGQEVPGSSIMGLMMLAAPQGSEILISAAGPEAKAALDALCKLVAERFGES